MIDKQFILTFLKENKSQLQDKYQVNKIKTTQVQGFASIRYFY